MILSSSCGLNGSCSRAALPTRLANAAGPLPLTARRTALATPVHRHAIQMHTQISPAGCLGLRVIDNHCIVAAVSSYLLKPCDDAVFQLWAQR
jgi:hypothetical protein